MSSYKYWPLHQFPFLSLPLGVLYEYNSFVDLVKKVFGTSLNFILTFSEVSLYVLYTYMDDGSIDTALSTPKLMKLQ